MRTLEGYRKQNFRQGGGITIQLCQVCRKFAQPDSVRLTNPKRGGSSPPEGHDANLHPSNPLPSPSPCGASNFQAEWQVQLGNGEWRGEEERRRVTSDQLTCGEANIAREVRAVRSKSRPSQSKSEFSLGEYPKVNQPNLLLKHRAFWVDLSVTLG